MFKRKHLVIAYIAYVLLVLGLSNLFDYVYYTYITKSAYEFTLSMGLFEPIFFGLISGYFLIIKDWSKKK